MPRSSNPDILLLHHRRDDEIAFKIVQALKKRNLSVNTSLDFGERSFRDIRDRFEKYELIIILWSLNSLESRQIYYSAKFIRSLNKKFIHCIVGSDFKEILYKSPVVSLEDSEIIDLTFPGALKPSNLDTLATKAKRIIENYIDEKKYISEEKDIGEQVDTKGVDIDEKEYIDKEEEIDDKKNIRKWKFDKLFAPVYSTLFYLFALLRPLIGQGILLVIIGAIFLSPVGEGLSRRASGVISPANIIIAGLLFCAAGFLLSLTRAILEFIAARRILKSPLLRKNDSDNRLNFSGG